MKSVFNFDNNYKAYIINRMKSWFAFYLSRHSKIFFIRITLKFPKDYAYNSKYPYISRFSQKITQYFKRKNYDPSYFWCREQYASIYPHFHFCFLLNGQKVQKPVMFTNKAKDLWQSTLIIFSQGLTNYDFSISIRQNEMGFTSQLNEAHQKAKYLCKAFTKIINKNGYRDFGMSRLRYE